MFELVWHAHPPICRFKENIRTSTRHIYDVYGDTRFFSLLDNIYINSQLFIYPNKPKKCIFVYNSIKLMQ